MKKKIWTEEAISKKLIEISASIPKNLQKYVVFEIAKTPTMEFVFRKALDSPDISEEKKAQIRILLATGDFSKMKQKEDPKIAKMIDNYVGRKINEAIKKGQLPPRSELKNLPWLKKLTS